jgi:hypothetical protein
MARGFAARGWTVAGCGTNEAAVASLAAELAPPHAILRCDLAANVDVERFAATLLDTLGPPDLLIDTDMLRSCWEEEAGAYPTPAQWAARAVPFLEQLGPRDNGRPLTVPG